MNIYERNALSMKHSPSTPYPPNTTRRPPLAASAVVQPTLEQDLPCVALPAHAATDLTEALAGLPGIRTTSERQYTYIGVGGFGSPGDFNLRVLLRVLLAINGKWVNDVMFDGATDRHGFPLYLAPVERIEFIPGPDGAQAVRIAWGVAGSCASPTSDRQSSARSRHPQRLTRVAPGRLAQRPAPGRRSRHG